MSKKNAVRNILLIGRTGSGKSTLANVLSETNEFKESDSSGSTTKEIKTKEFKVVLGENENIFYRVIDTIGIGDTVLSHKEVIIRIAEVCKIIKEDGLYQILFVTNGKFTNEELEAYNVLRRVIFEEEIANYTTIIRTNFKSYKEEEKCEKETNLLGETSPKLDEIVRVCKGIIYVDNPSTSENDEDYEILSKIDKSKRESSKKKILDHLSNKCGNYKPISLEKIGERVSSYMTEKEQLEEKLKELEGKSTKEREKAEVRMKELEKKISELGSQIRCIVS